MSKNEYHEVKVDGIPYIPKMNLLINLRIVSNSKDLTGKITVKHKMHLMWLLELSTKYRRWNDGEIN